MSHWEFLQRKGQRVARNIWWAAGKDWRAAGKSGWGGEDFSLKGIKTLILSSLSNEIDWKQWISLHGDDHL
jgi:hypothetical protein